MTLSLVTILLIVCQLSWVIWAEVQVVEVAFPGTDDITFEGFLYLPFPEDTKKQVPGVILVHGSGPHSRDVPMTGQNSVFWNTPILVFQEIATQLARQGMVVLTYDKRSCSRYNNCYNNSYPFLGPYEYTSVNVFLDDAAEAAKFLQNHDAVISDAVVVAGHSQSGQFLPSILLENPSLLGGIMLAGPFQPIHKILEYQVQFTKDLLENVYGLSPEEQLTNFPNPQILIDLKDNVTDLAAGELNVTRGEENRVLVGGIPVSFWQSWIDLADTALEDVARISQRLLIVNGDMDSNVPPSEAESWAAYLDDLGASDRYDLEIFRCLTHAFNCIDAPDYSMPLDASAISLFVDPRLPETMAAWIKKLVNATGVGGPTESPLIPGDTETPSPEPSSCNGKQRATFALRCILFMSLLFTLRSI